MDLSAYLDALASAEPTPGGGSAGAVAGGLAAALLAMVARITAAGDRPPELRAAAAAVTVDADRLRAAFAAARTADEAAYGGVVAAQGLPRGPERQERLQAALAAAAEAPLAAAGLAAAGMALAERTAALGNRHVMSDVVCAIHLLRATLESAAANVAANHAYLKDQATLARQQAALAAARAELEAAAVRAAAAAR